jgi:alginate O-acetyltransferase complex protein AlgJ
MKITQLAAAAMLAGATAAGAAQAADAAPGFAGKNEWLFYNYELSGPKDAATVATSVDLLARFNKVLAANGVVLGVTMVPIKMRVYAEHLPDSVKLSDDLRGNYARIAQSMRASQLRVIDLNTAFTTSPERTGESPLYFRLDTHWAPAGALLAGTTIKAGIDADPVLKAALDQAPVEAFKLVVGKRKINSKSRDLVEQLPKPAPVFGPEPTFAFDVTRATPAKEDLLGNRLAPPVTLVGSSYSHAWTGFPNALRHALQRDVLSVSVGADQGSWVGMESYLRDDAFQGSPP